MQKEEKTKRKNFVLVRKEPKRRSFLIYEIWKWKHPQMVFKVFSQGSSIEFWGWVRWMPWWIETASFVYFENISDSPLQSFLFLMNRAMNNDLNFISFSNFHLNYHQKFRNHNIGRIQSCQRKKKSSWSN